MERMDKGNMVVVSEVSDAMCKGASADITQQFAHWYLSMDWCLAQFVLLIDKIAEEFVELGHPWGLLSYHI